MDGRFKMMLPSILGPFRWTGADPGYVEELERLFSEPKFGTLEERDDYFFKKQPGGLRRAA